MRVALIEAGSPGLNIYSHVAMGRGVPLLATVLRDAGYDVRAFVEDIGGKGSIDWEFVERADVVGFSAITCTMTRTAELVSRVRSANPNAVIIMGGPEPTCATGRAFDAGADWVIRGEAERSLPEFLGMVRDGLPRESLQQVPGIVWREDGELLSGPPPRQLDSREISTLPIIDMSLVAGAEHQTTGLVWRGRGCPERCTFCEVHEIWPHYVLRDEYKSAEELMRLQESGRGGAFLIDDNCAANKPSFKRFLQQAIDRGWSRPIAVQLRADAVFNRDGRIDRELLRLLHNLAPVTMLCVGVESASDDDLEQVAKREDSKRMAQALKAIRRQGLLVHGMFIAFAGDTVETLKRNGQFARKYVTSLQYLFETPLPGTKATAQHEAAGRVLFHDVRELKFLDGMHVAIKPNNMSPARMQAVVIAEYRKFYSRMRVARAFMAGLFLRYRRLGEGHRAYLRTLRPWKRFRQWVWLHLEFKFAPWMFLRIGRKRVLAFLKDPDYLDYLARLES